MEIMKRKTGPTLQAGGRGCPASCHKKHLQKHTPPINQCKREPAIQKGRAALTKPGLKPALLVSFEYSEFNCSNAYLYFKDEAVVFLCLSNAASVIDASCNIC